MLANPSSKLGQALQIATIAVGLTVGLMLKASRLSLSVAVHTYRRTNLFAGPSAVLPLMQRSAQEGPVAATQAVLQLVLPLLLVAALAMLQLALPWSPAKMPLPAA